MCNPYPFSGICSCWGCSETFAVLSNDLGPDGLGGTTLPSCWTSSWEVDDVWPRPYNGTSVDSEISTLHIGHSGFWLCSLDVPLIHLYIHDQVGQTNNRDDHKITTGSFTYSKHISQSRSLQHFLCEFALVSPRFDIILIPIYRYKDSIIYKSRSKS
jgi:hypothetical protein